MTGEHGAAPAVTAVVLNWHGRADTLECLRALAALRYPRLRLLLIDNGCAEFDQAEVAGLLRGASYRRTAENLGFAGGANLGMRQALGDGADYVWFLNNDARPEPEALRELVGAAEADPATAIVGPKILQGHDPRRIDSVALRVDLRTGRLYLTGHDEIDSGQYDDISEVTAVTGCAMLVRRSACERLSGFDETFFAYVEDADLCLRAREADFRIRCVPAARVLHYRAPATAARQSASSLYYATRNHLMLLRRHAPRPRWPLMLSAVALNLAYALRAGAPRSRRQRVRAVLRAVADYRRGVGGASWPGP